MEAVVLVAALALSLIIAVGGAYGTLMLAMYLIEVATNWTAAPAHARPASSSGWANTLPESAATSEHPLAA
jgi:hypothetical protein